MAKTKNKEEKEVREKYFDAIEVKEIATKIINDNTFVFPRNCPILYLFIDKSKSFWGKCSKASEIMTIASGYEFVIVINHEQWQILNDTQREGLVYHELCHCGYDSEKGKYYIVDHDVEEFSSVIRRYGLWRDSVKTFVNAAMTKVEQV